LKLALQWAHERLSAVNKTAHKKDYSRADHA